MKKIILIMLIIVGSYVLFSCDDQTSETTGACIRFDTSQNANYCQEMFKENCNMLAGSTWQGEDVTCASIGYTQTCPGESGTFPNTHTCQ